MSHPLSQDCLSCPNLRLAGRVSGSLSPDPLGELLKKNLKPLQTRWADQYLKKSETPPDPLGRPVLEKSETPPDPLGRPVLEKKIGILPRPVGQTSTKPDSPGPVGCQNSTKKTRPLPLFVVFDDRWQRQKNWQNPHIVDAGAGPSQPNIAPAQGRFV